MHDLLRRLFTGRGVGRKNFAGDIFDRMRGLEFILARCSGCSVLDIGSNEGLISYEFARNGIKLVHGFERDGQRVAFSKRLFRDVPVEAQFVKANLAVSGVEFERRHRSILLRSYDIVLFLGVYHHLKKQMTIEDLHGLVGALLDRSDTWFVNRGNSVHEYEPMILSKGFRLVYSLAGIKGKGGAVHIYRKGEASADTVPTAN